MGTVCLDVGGEMDLRAVEGWLETLLWTRLEKPPQRPQQAGRAGRGQEGGGEERSAGEATLQVAAAATAAVAAAASAALPDVYRVKGLLRGAGGRWHFLQASDART